MIYNPGGWLIFKALLNERVVEGVASDPHDFIAGISGDTCWLHNT